MGADGSDQDVPRARGRTPIPWRKDAAILARMAKVEPLHFERWPNTAIAAELGVDEGTVRNDLKRLQELWLERHGAEQDAVRAQLLAELDDIKGRALAAARFDETAERAVLLGEEMLGKDGKSHFVQRDDKGSAQFRGNKAAALTVARQVIMDKAKVHGVVTEKVQHDGTPDYLAALQSFGQESGQRG